MVISYQVRRWLSLQSERQRRKSPITPDSMSLSTKDANQPTTHVSRASGTTSRNLATGNAHKTASPHTSAVTHPAEVPATSAPTTATGGDQAENEGAALWSVVVMRRGTFRTGALRAT